MSKMKVEDKRAKGVYQKIVFVMAEHKTELSKEGNEVLRIGSSFC